MNNDDRSDRDVHPRRRWGAYAAGLSAAVGAALAAAMIPAAPAFADPAGDAVAAAAGDAVPALAKQTEEGILNGEITTFYGDIHDPSLAGPDIQFTDYLLGLLPGGGTGTDATGVETFLVTDVYTPLIDAFGGGERTLDAAAAISREPEDAILNNDITTFYGDIHDPSLAGPDIQFTDFLLGLLPGGVNGTDAIDVETVLVNDIYTPLIELLGGGGGMMMF
ncbi:MAG: hypothetical protein QOG95_5360 [Mycobacterium sp.]|jgi:hypothetical protein|nr:hypothetical protein [Mycobacterium sp.]